MIKDEEEILETVPGATGLELSAADSTDGEAEKAHGKQVGLGVDIPLLPHGI